MAKEIKGILFDFNGTMVFDSPQHKKAWNVFSNKYRHKDICDEELDQMHGRTNKNIISLLLEKPVDVVESEQLSKDKEALYREICRREGSNYHLVDGLEKLLNELKYKQIPMTICSASIKENIDFFIEIFGLKRWFDVDRIIYDDGTHINKISMFQKGANAIGVPIENCLIIEDSLSGLRYAHDVHAAHIIAITTKDRVEEYAAIPGVDDIILDYTNITLPL